jgi:FkbM family methyltransferase
MEFAEMTVFKNVFTSLINPRWWRKFFAKLIPEKIKSNLRNRLFGFGYSKLSKQIYMNASKECLIIAINDVSIKLLSECNESIQYHCFENKDSVEEITSFVNASIIYGGLLIDVGAADGMFSIFHCNAGQMNRAIAYEPGGLFKNLNKNKELNELSNKLSCRNEAIGAINGEISGMMHPNGMFVAQSEANLSEHVKMVCLDQVLKNGEHPSIIKIDVEGYELEVLVGAREMLKKYKPLVFLELHLDILEKNKISSATILSELSKIGYVFETPLGSRLSINQISKSAKAIYRLIARPKADL